MNEQEVVYDWNLRGHAVSPPIRRVELHDETLRDGIQCPSVHDPSIAVKQEVVRKLALLGVYSVNVGLPGAGPRAVHDSTVLVEMVRDEKLPIRVGAAARTHANDVKPIIEISQKTGVPIEIMTFLGCSPIRITRKVCRSRGWSIPAWWRRCPRPCSRTCSTGTAITTTTG